MSAESHREIVRTESDAPAKARERSLKRVVSVRCVACGERIQVKNIGLATSLSLCGSCARVLPNEKGQR